MSGRWGIVSPVIVYVANYCAIRSPRRGGVSLTTNQFEAHLAPGERPRLNIAIPLRGQYSSSRGGIKRPMVTFPRCRLFIKYPQIFIDSSDRYLRVLITISIIEEKCISWCIKMIKIYGRKVFKFLNFINRYLIKNNIEDCRRCARDSVLNTENNALISVVYQCYDVVNCRNTYLHRVF